MIQQAPSKEHAPEYSDQYFRHLFESSDETAIVLLGAEGEITGWNRGAERLLGWSAEEALGEHGALFFTEEDRKAGAPEEEVERAKEHGWADDTRWHVKKSGERFWANGVVEGVEDREGNVIGFAKVIRDRTQEKQYEKALEEKTKELKKSNQRLESFASYVAHEIRSPLVGAKLLLDVLFEQNNDRIEPDEQERIREVQHTLEDVNRFVSDLLSYSRLAGGEEIEREPVHTYSIVEEAREDLRPHLEDAGGEIEVGDLPDVYAHGTYLKHLFRNLFSNALKYNDSEVPRVRVEAAEQTDPDERVRVKDSSESQAWVFSVADNGVGIPEEERKKNFDLFQRGGEGEEIGVGVGLALSRQIVEAHGGEMWVESDPGQGSTFFFTLPKAEKVEGTQK